MGRQATVDVQSSLKQSLQVQLAFIFKQVRAAAFLIAGFDCLAHLCLTPPPTPASWQRHSCAHPEEAGKGESWSLGFLHPLLPGPPESALRVPPEYPFSKKSQESFSYGWQTAMGTRANTPGYAYAASWAKGSLRLQIQMLKGLATSESWLPLAMQALKSIISFVYILLERLSSLWQVQRVMFLVALHRSIIRIEDLQVCHICEWVFLQKAKDTFVKSTVADSPLSWETFKQHKFEEGNG